MGSRAQVCQNYKTFLMSQKPQHAQLALITKKSRKSAHFIRWNEKMKHYIKILGLINYHIIFLTKRFSTNQGLLFVKFGCMFFQCGGVDVYICITCIDGGLWDLLLIDIKVQRSLAQLLKAASGGPAEALQRQTHILLSDEQRFHHTFGCIQQVHERNLNRRTI